MELKPAGKSGKVKAQIGETMLLSRYVAEARRAAKDAEKSAQRAETVLLNKQDKLVSGVNIKTVNDQNVLGSGNIVISGNGSSIAIDSELSDTSVNAVQNRVITGAVREIERALNAPPPIGLGMTGATAGQVPVVKTVDANGIPTSYEPGAGGGGVPTGGADGDVLVKNGATDYAAKWTNTPKLMENFAVINHESYAETTYYKGNYLVYNGKLYIVTADTISQGVTLSVGNNIDASVVSTDIKALKNSKADKSATIPAVRFFDSGNTTQRTLHIPNAARFMLAIASSSSAYMGLWLGLSFSGGVVQPLVDVKGQSGYTFAYGTNTLTITTDSRQLEFCIWLLDGNNTDAYYII